MKRERRKFSASFKAKVAIEALKEKETQIRQKEEEIRLLKHQLDRARL